MEAPKQFYYERWRHGGWYVTNVLYPSGACGCVSRNYPDGKWRIVCDSRDFEDQPTFPNRHAAALAEWHLAQDAAVESRFRAAMEADPLVQAWREYQRRHHSRQRYSGSPLLKTGESECKLRS